MSKIRFTAKKRTFKFWRISKSKVGRRMVRVVPLSSGRKFTVVDEAPLFFNEASRKSPELTALFSGENQTRGVVNLDPHSYEGELNKAISE